jgi:hypothetical protein
MVAEDARLSCHWVIPLAMSVCLQSWWSSPERETAIVLPRFKRALEALPYRDTKCNNVYNSVGRVRKTRTSSA